jgi:predicted DsbA family dithiol-disulfide isomerase
MTEKKLILEVTSDFVCPWCLIGHIRLERAIKDSGLEDKIKIHWLPYELNPLMSSRGMDRTEYLSRKFGSTERLKELDAHMKEVGLEDGIEFRHDLIKTSPNTLDAHRLTWLAQEQHREKADALVRRIFMAYFTEGKDIGKKEELAKLADEIGIDGIEVREFLMSGKGTDEVRELERDAGMRGVRMVPNFLINGQEIRGAVPSSDIEEILKAA